MQLVSVIIATFNGEKTLERKLISILKQDGLNRLFKLEIIVVDDCSTDSTVAIASKYPCRILSTTTNSGGPNKGRNMGLKSALGDYICIADQDDVWELHKLVTLLPYLERAKIVSSGYTLIDNLHNKTERRVKESPQGFINYAPNETFLKKLERSLNSQNTYLGSLIFHKSLASIHFEERFGMVDYDWLLRLFHNQASIEVCQSLHTRYVNGNNLSLKENYRKADFYYSLLSIEEFEEKYPRQVAKSYKKIHGSRARYYYLVGKMDKARFFFRQSNWNLKTLLYIITSYLGSNSVKKNFNVFG